MLPKGPPCRQEFSKPMADKILPVLSPAMLVGINGDYTAESPRKLTYFDITFPLINSLSSSCQIFEEICNNCDSFTFLQHLHV